MNAVAPITVRPLERPHFDNALLGHFNLWVDINASTLARYWHDQGNALGLGKDEDSDFSFWLRVQHDIELNARKRAGGSR